MYVLACSRTLKHENHKHRTCPLCLFLQTLNDEKSSSSDEDHSFSTSLDTTQDLLSPDHPPPLPLSKAAHTTAGSSRNEKPRTISPSLQKTSQSLSHATAGKDNLKSIRKQKRQKDKLFDDTDSDSDIFTSNSGDMALPFPAGVSQTVATSDPLNVFDGSDDNKKSEGERVSVLRLSDSSDDSVVMAEKQGSVLPGSGPQSVHLQQKCSQVITFAVNVCINFIYCCFVIPPAQCREQTVKVRAGKFQR